MDHGKLVKILWGIAGVVGVSTLAAFVVLMQMTLQVTSADPQGRAEAHARQCRDNLRDLSAAKERWAFDYGKSAGAEVGMADLRSSYLKKEVACPAKGTYVLGAVGTRPYCEYAGGRHELTTEAGTAAP